MSKVSLVSYRRVNSSKKDYCCDCCSRNIPTSSKYYRGFARVNDKRGEFFVCDKCNNSLVVGKLTFNVIEEKFT